LNYPSCLLLPFVWTCPRVFPRTQVGEEYTRAVRLASRSANAEPHRPEPPNPSAFALNLACANAEWPISSACANAGPKRLETSSEKRDSSFTFWFCGLEQPRHCQTVVRCSILTDAHASPANNMVRPRSLGAGYALLNEFTPRGVLPRLLKFAPDIVLFWCVSPLRGDFSVQKDVWDASCLFKVR
jgi:hypothetical protein